MTYRIIYPLTSFSLLMFMNVACHVSPLESAEYSMRHSNPFAVGSSTFFIHDYGRPYDSVAGLTTGVRTLITELWYPVDHSRVAANDTSFTQARYADYVFGNRAVHQLMMTNTTFFHLTPDTVRDNVSDAQIEAAIEELFNRKRMSFRDAPLAVTAEKLPVVVMSHGDAGSRYNMETVCEYLAAQGYLVIAPEHTGNSPYSMTGNDPFLSESTGDANFRSLMKDVLAELSEQGVYGSEARFGQSYAPGSTGGSAIQNLIGLDKALLQRVNDLRATLDELAVMNQNGMFAGRLALDRVGLMGRSFGGATTLAALNMEDRFAAGVAVVPPAFADPRASVPSDMLRPSQEESVLLSEEGEFPLTTISKPTLLLVGEEDDLIIGLSASMANNEPEFMPTSDNPHPALRYVYHNTTAPVVWASLANSNHATLGISGEYWWPQLKPGVQTRYFAPAQTFTLIEPVLAHTIQKEKALALFDLTIRGRKSAMERLADQRYKDAGLTLELRNF